MDCVGGNDKDIDACVEVARGEEEAADAFDCADEYDDAFDCKDENASCKGGNWNDGDGDCQEERSALSKCVRSASSRD